MKKIITTCIAVLFSAVVLQAQINPGIKAGMNIANLHGDNADVHSKVGLHLGALAHIHLSDQFALQPEIVYSMQGAKSRDTGDDVRLNLDYLNIPVLVQYMFDNGFRIQAGPQLGFLLNAKLKNDDTSVDAKDNYNSIDLSFPIGVGYVTQSGFGVDARYVFGVSNVSEDDNDKLTNGGLQIGVFYQFGQQ